VAWGTGHGPAGADVWGVDMPEALRKRVGHRTVGDVVELGGACPDLCVWGVDMPEALRKRVGHRTVGDVVELGGACPDLCV
jgi:hypothetical protein